MKLIDELNRHILPFDDTKSIDILIEDIADAQFVMIGEASHGTQEFYQIRMQLSQRLIAEKGFMAIAVEGDWPDVHALHQYIHGNISLSKAYEVFQRFPKWMWANECLKPFYKWLKRYNSSAHHKVGIYGMDLYSLQNSIHTLVSYLENHHPELAIIAKEQYACFDHVHPDPQTYGYITSQQIKKSCVNEVIRAFSEIQHHVHQFSHEAYFFQSQNARLIQHAEKYYRAMFQDHISSWNIRDRHMAETINCLADYLENKHQKPAKIIIWAHNSHLGDARATELSEKGEINLGQLIREQHLKTYSIGFSTYEGTVTAAQAWDGPYTTKNINPGLHGSYEQLFHELQYPNFILPLRNKPILDHIFSISRLQRAIGVIYRPESERMSHYFFTRLPYQFDCVIHCDKTNALS
jgi:erythromycin esterase-like protein